MPEYEWPTSTVGPSISANVRRAVLTSSSRVRSGFCTDATLSPRACRNGMTSAQHDPSAYAPWTNTTFRAGGGGWLLIGLPLADGVPISATALPNAKPETNVLLFISA